MKRVLSGIQPSGNPHLGNFLGAMRQHIAMQETHECFYFIANYHALTTIRDAKMLHQYTRELATDYLALGIDPEKTVFFKQNDVPELAELAWIFDTVTPMGLLERAHAWKDAKAKGKKGETVGLFNYPVLMACDILMYKPDFVPVGQDQKQHVEIACDIAGYFNNIYGPTFKLPEAVIKEDVAVVPGTDGQKMSKSYGNVIDIFAPADVLKKQVYSIVTDSRDVTAIEDFKESILWKLLRLVIGSFSNEKEFMEYASERLEKMEGKIGYKILKDLLFNELLERFSEARARRLELLNKQDYVDDVLANGGAKARKVAEQTMNEVLSKTGLR